MNLGHHPPAEETNWPPTSVSAETGAEANFDTALVILAARLDHWMSVMRTDGFPAVRAAWLERAINLGREIAVRLPNETLIGEFTGLTEDGALILQTRDGARQISAGDVYFPGDA